MNYDTRHGGPFDRGAADSWYSRPKNPHYFVGASYMTTEVKEKDMAAADIQAYYAGYEHNEKFGGKKDWS